MPPIGKADHDIVYVEYDIKAKRIQQAPRKIYLYKRAGMDGLRDHLARYRDSFLSSDHGHMSVNDMWVSFKSEVIAAIERVIPSKMTKTKYSSSWIDSSIKRLIKRATDFTSVLASQAALTFRAITNGSEHMFKRSSEMHIGSIFPISSLLIQIALIPIVPEKMRRRKSFGHLSSPSRKTRLGSIHSEKVEF